MILDNSSKNIILISYPSGGFGNFIYYILTEIASDTVKIDNSNFDFNSDGNSHQAIKYTKEYFHEPDNYWTEISSDMKNKQILILCDNGITNDNYSKVNITFPNANLIRLTIDEDIRPVIFQMCIFKALQQTSIVDHTNSHVNINWTDANEDYAIRENFTFLYKNWQFGWEPHYQAINLSLKSLIVNPVTTITSLINNLGMTVVDNVYLQEICNKWLTANQKYFNIYYNTKKIMNAISTNTDIDISDITELHDQGYINFCIEELYNIIIPVYDYRDWFQTTGQISTAIKNIKRNV